MAIRTLPAPDVDALLTQLHGPASLEREAAIARLRVIGARAHTRVLALIADASAPRDVRVAAIRVIEGIDDPRVRRTAAAATADNDIGVATAAIQAVRPWITGDTRTDVLELVSGIVVDESRPTAVRRSALDALAELPPELTEPLVALVEAQLAATAPLHDPASARDWLARHETASPGALHDLLAHARDRGRDAADTPDGRDWLAVRGAVHAVLARRGSRIALYDAREMLDRATAALPVDLIAAVRSIGDPSCLEPLAKAWEAAQHDDWWRDQLRLVAGEIVAREGLTGRHALIKRVKTRWPGFLA